MELRLDNSALHPPGCASVWGLALLADLVSQMWGFARELVRTHREGGYGLRVAGDSSEAEAARTFSWDPAQGAAVEHLALGWLGLCYPAQGWRATASHGATRR